MKCPRCGQQIKNIPPPSNVQTLEVEWYRQHGRYPERIKRDGSGYEFVVGDQGWNGLYPSKAEQVEGRMRADGVYRAVS